MWASEATLPDSMPGDMAGKTIPKNKVSLVIFIILTLMLALIFWNAAENTATVGLPGGGGGGNTDLVTDGVEPIEDYAQENSRDDRVVPIEEKAIAQITFTLTWEDEEDDAPPVVTNEPDEFALNVTTPWGESNETAMTANERNEQGVVSLEFIAPGEYPDSGSAGDYNVSIIMGEAGDQLSSTPLIQAGFNDNGNDWTLTVSYTYWKEASDVYV